MAETDSRSVAVAVAASVPGAGPGAGAPPPAALALELRQAGPIPLDLSLRCGPGELLALVGPSGSGKTTILRSVAGLYRPAWGKVDCAGQCWLDTDAGIHLPARRRAVGMVFQSYALFPHLSAIDNVLEAIPRSAPDRRARAARHLRSVNLQGLEDRLPRQLSGGQQQRVAVARALAREPSVLLLDEPFSAVDKVTREKLYGELAELRRTLEIPILLVTHDLDEATLLADRLALLSRGRILQQGAPLEVLHRPSSVEVARLAGMKNIFGGRVIRHDAAAQSTWIDWEGLAVQAPLAEALAPGDEIAWAIPADGVLLLSAFRPMPPGDTRFDARITRIIALGAQLHVTVQPFDRPGLPMALTVARHIAERQGLREGDPVPLRLRGRSIQLMPKAGRGERTLRQDNA
ncbi:ABC transporter ATP-binding protein [Burkholderiaceae bacterium FT117]|uniref:ABC transporter ATP-binding protein n=1 Tax=Zeimonas sediminis TaxID=2944268 RepID=UPI00234312BA|nr:ABC transporter ATP-binding protein [Zeimonas sediminis]MCM5569303.1 ABC transporter ATP-binding protein [Zeimonas sediminis]